MAKFCGGFRLGDTLQLVNGVITLADHEEEIDSFATPCGQLFDGNIFEVVKIDGSKVLTAIGVNEEIPATKPISTCGLWLDSRFFTITNKTINFTERHILEVLHNPPDVEVTIAVTYNQEAVEPFEGTTVYPLDNIDGEYTITVTAEGYEEATETVTADQDHIVTIELTPTA